MISMKVMSSMSWRCIGMLTNILWKKHTLGLTEKSVNKSWRDWEVYSCSKPFSQGSYLWLTDTTGQEVTEAWLNTVLRSLHVNLNILEQEELCCLGVKSVWRVFERNSKVHTNFTKLEPVESHQCNELHWQEFRPRLKKIICHEKHSIIFTRHSIKEVKTLDSAMEQHGDVLKNHLTCHQTNQPTMIMSDCHAAGI